MNDLRTAAEQALELCDRINDERTVWGQHELRAVCEALRAALAEPVQEPVAWLAPDGSVRKTPAAKSFREWAWGPNDFKPLYLAPPQRKPLTNDQITAINASLKIGTTTELVRAVERAHVIGGDA